MLSRHSEGTSRRERVSMYPWIKVVRTRDKKGNAAWENIPKLATKLHPNYSVLPRDCWKGAERSLGEGSVCKGAVRMTRAGECQGMQDRLSVDFPLHPV